MFKRKKDKGKKESKDDQCDSGSRSTVTTSVASVNSEVDSRCGRESANVKETSGTKLHTSDDDGFVVVSKTGGGESLHEVVTPLSKLRLESSNGSSLGGSHSELSNSGVSAMEIRNVVNNEVLTEMRRNTSTLRRSATLQETAWPCLQGVPFTVRSDRVNQVDLLALLNDSFIELLDEKLCQRSFSSWSYEFRDERAFLSSL